MAGPNVLLVWRRIQVPENEALCDFVETRHNEKIGIIKDIAGAGVGIAMLAWLLVLGFEAGEMLRKLPREVTPHGAPRPASPRRPG